MARVELAPEVLEDFERILDHLDRFEVDHAERRIAEIVDSIDVLTRSPRIGRPVDGGLRELVIGSGARGYVALYRYLDTVDTVFVLAVRGQREGGYPRG